MLYREAADDATWIELSRLLGEREPLDMVLHLYPDTDAPEFPSPFRAAADPEPLEPVTAYDGGIAPSHSERLVVTPELIASLRDHVGAFEDWGDDMSLHRPGDRGWVAAYIPHEQMVLLADCALETFVIEGGLGFAQEPPEWW